ncbi:hypothetical protein [Pseudoalteromonas sp. T1lg48]|uniref:hypothetical protein n=1 Tax=Pseudoalteromonas sp. T1lg48 TaxID=2077100 RepID=UPI000CF60289|nr:hypothetical protein [Pseudoalteromonas sp. T1lg48]
MGDDNKKVSLDQQLQQQTLVRGSQIRNYVLVAAITLALVLLAIVWHAVSSAPATESTAKAEPQADSEMAIAARGALNEALREQVQQAILTFEQQHQALLTNEQVIAFAPELQQQTSSAFDAALQAFAQGQFRQAQERLQQSDGLATRLARQWQQAIDSWYQQALLALNDQRPQEARLYVDKMRALNQADERIDELQQRIQTFAQQQSLWRDYQGAVAERDVDKQAALLTQLVVLQPQRQELQDKLNAAKETIRKRRIAQRVKEAQQALAQQNFIDAQRAITQLQRLQADGDTLGLLRAQLSKQQRQLSTERTRALVLSASEQQAWQQVESLAQQYLARAPGDSTITRLLARAEQVLAAQRALSNYTARPKRLSDSNIRAQAEAALTKAEIYAPYSQQLANSIAELNQHLRHFSTPIAVTLLSDKQTQVHIYGVEQLGEFAQKQVMLLPGSYTLEGRRAGYVSVKYELEVSATDTPITLTIACTQRI